MVPNRNRTEPNRRRCNLKLVAARLIFGVNYDSADSILRSAGLAESAVKMDVVGLKDDSIVRVDGVCRIPLKTDMHAQC
jgi:hypothetical protein